MNGPLPMSASRPLYPRKRTSTERIVMSALCQKRTLAKAFNGVELAGLLPPGTSAGKFPKTHGTRASTIFRQAEGYRCDASLPAAGASL